MDLLRQRGIEPRIVGRPHGSSNAVKMLDVGWRAVELSRAFVPARPDILLGTSRSAALAGWGMRIPVFGFCDYEHADMRVLRLTRMYVFHPDVIDVASFTRQGVNARPSVAVLRLEGDDLLLGHRHRGNRASIASRPEPVDLVHVLLRPPGEQAHYFVPESGRLFNDLLRYLSEREDVVVVYSPRYEHQVSYLDEFEWANSPVVLHEAVSFVPLLKSVDVVISSGGTMLREAAYLGIPAYSILRSAIGQVDHYLESIGRVRILESRADFDAMRLEHLERLSPMATSST